ncbi:hypothetical protein HBB16_12235 [Pseudonocardia sp. MCCB 268]|nr:hypothetical protein [Pseudonocardia cytotoxica]
MSTADHEPADMRAPAGHELLLRLAGRVPDEAAVAPAGLGRRWGPERRGQWCCCGRCLARHRSDRRRACPARGARRLGRRRWLVDAVQAGLYPPLPTFGPGRARPGGVVGRVRRAGRGQGAGRGPRRRRLVLAGPGRRSAPLC